MERGEGAHTLSGLIQGFTGRKSNFVRRKVWLSLHPGTLSAGKPPAHPGVLAAKVSDFGSKLHVPRWAPNLL